MVGGWSNILTGMLLHGYSNSYITVAGVVVGIEMLGLTGWVWRVYRKKQQRDDEGDWDDDGAVGGIRKKKGKKGPAWAKEEGENYFAVEGDEGDDKDSLDLADGSDEQRMGMLSNEEVK